MATMSISFRIADHAVGGRSYNDRYLALDTEIRQMADGALWEESTAFVALQTNLAIDQIAARCKRAIAPTADLVLILDNDHKSARLVGRNDDQSIKVILPYLQNF